MIRWLPGTIGSMIWGAIVFSAGLSFFFPGEWLKSHLSYQVQEGTQQKVLLHIGDASYSGIGGISLSQVSLFNSKPGRRKSGTTEKPPRENSLMTTIDKIYLRPQLLPLLGGTAMASLGLELSGGRMDLEFGASPSKMFLASDTEDFDLSVQPFEMEDGQLDLRGMLDVVGEIEFDLDDIKESTGEMAFTIEDLALIGGSISGFTLSETTFSEAELVFNVENGKANVTKGSFVGDLLEATIDGHITLREDLSRSRLSLTIEVRFDDTLDKLARIALKDSRDDEGVYHFRGRGTVLNPQFRADRVKGRSGRRSAASSSSDNETDANSEGASDRRTRRTSTFSDEDREERREKRRERLKKRRDRMRKRREERREESRDRSREREQEAEYFDGADDQFEDDIQGNNDARTNLPPPIYEEEIEPEFNEFEDPNDPNGGNGNLDDLGYIDE
jgi:type II secretion system protein N